MVQHDNFFPQLISEPRSKKTGLPEEALHSNGGTYMTTGCLKRTYQRTEVACMGLEHYKCGHLYLKSCCVMLGADLYILSMVLTAHTDGLVYILGSLKLCLKAALQ